MKTRRLLTIVTLACSLPLILPLAACSGQDEAAAARLAAARQPKPMTNLQIAQDAYGKSDFPKALDHFLAAAQEGDVNAEYYAAAMLSVGDGARKDFPRAVKMFESAAEKEQPDALYALARLYLVGDGVDRNPERSLAFFDRAIAAYPPGEARDHAIAQRTALVNVLKEQGKLPSTMQPEAQFPDEPPASSKPSGAAAKKS